MRHSPLDGPDGRGRERTPAEPTTAANTVGIVSRLRGVIERVATAIRRRQTEWRAEGGRQFSRDHTGNEPEVFDEAPDSRTKPVVLDRGGTSNVSSEGRDARDRPELVARWQDGRLTLSEPDAAGAQITSDLWVEVDA